MIYYVKMIFSGYCDFYSLPIPLLLQVLKGLIFRVGSRLNNAYRW